MAMIRSRVNLKVPKFPLISKNIGQTVMVGGADLDPSIPQIIYCENVLPFEEGMQSAWYRPLADDTANNNVRKIFRARNNLTNEMIYFSMIVSGPDQWKVLTYFDGGSGAVSKFIVVTAIAGYVGGLITTANINGLTYIYFEGATDPCRLYNFAASTLAIVTLTNFSANLVTAPKGIFASNGYLCGWSATRITWSSLVSVIDFVPSLVTGAGFTGIQDAASEMMIVKAHARGAIIYTRTNAVGMVYTNNKAFPWNFRDIPGAGGCETEPLMTRIEDEKEYHYAYTTYGLQKLTPTNCQMFLPEVTEFLSGNQLESYDSATNVFTYTSLGTGNPLFKKLAMIASRYLCISYGLSQTAFEYVLVIDIITGRWGKLKTTHVEVFEWQDFNAYANRELPRQSIGLLTQLSGLSVTGLEQWALVSSGILILGRYQYIRARNLQLQKVSSQNVSFPGGASTYSVKTGVSLNGQEIARTITGTLLSPNPNVLATQTKIHGFESAVGINHTLVVNGTFALNSMTLEFNNHGRN